MSALNDQVGGNHYKEMAIQPIEFCQKNKLGYAESLAIKYICRHGKKNGREDIKKAIHCLNLLLEIEYPEKPEQCVSLHNIFLQRVIDGGVFPDLSDLGMERE